MQPTPHLFADFCNTIWAVHALSRIPILDRSNSLQELEAGWHGDTRRRGPRAGHHAPLRLRHEDDVAADGGHPHLVPVQGQGVRGGCAVCLLTILLLLLLPFRLSLLSLLEWKIVKISQKKGERAPSTFRRCAMQSLLLRRNSTFPSPFDM